MPVESFSLQSPGVFIEETDNSRFPQRENLVGSVVIGTAPQGPGMRPVTLNSPEEAQRIFGRQYASGISEDVWRSGRIIESTFGLYAAEAYFANKSPVTYVRLLGTDNPNALTGSSLTQAGWSVPKIPTADPATNGGAYALFMGVTAGSDLGLDATGNRAFHLAATFYVKEGGLTLTATNMTGQTATSGNGVALKSTGANGAFSISVTNTSGNEVERIPFNMNRSSSSYLRKVFNTNPTVTNEEINKPENLKTYWLGQSYDQYINEVINFANDTGGLTTAVLVPIENSLVSGGKYIREASPGRTGWVVSQDKGLNTAFTPGVDGKYPNLSKLFYIEALDSGSWESKNLKVSISNILPSRISTQSYGSFDVEVRNVSDTDRKKQTVEVFAGVNLDPTSPDYIAARIGDTKTVWNEDEKVYEEIGEFVNQSTKIRVVVSDDVAFGNADASLLPFGYLHSAVYRTGNLDTTPVTPPTGAAVYDYDNTEGIWNSGVGGGEEVRFPKFSQRKENEDENSYWGLNTLLSGSTRTFDPSYCDLVHPFAAITDVNATNALQFVPSLMTLDDLVQDTNSPSKFTWTEGARLAGTSYTASIGSPEDLLFASQNAFTMPLVGGFDGLDITEKNPFRNTLLKGESELTHYAYNSIKRAMDSVRDKEVLDYDLITVPGLTNPSLKEHLADICETRGDAMAIVDLENDYAPASEGLPGIYPKEPNLDGMIQEVLDQELDTSFAATYSSWPQIVDSQTGRKLYVPPSTILLGTYAYSERVSQPWFAPAGLQRGGLNRSTAGLSVTNLRSKWTKAQRDKMYAVGINPISRLAGNNFAVLGQKTLQIEDSFLSRVNVRRMINTVKRSLGLAAERILFEQNVESTWQKFTGEANAILADVQSKAGIRQYKLVLDDTTTTQDLIDRNIIYAKVLIMPETATEFIVLDFSITNNLSDFS